ncbi:MAG: Uma2 family endonuclease [Syntrophobacteraceae bacterium]
MREPAKRKATYEDLYSVPENMIGEIIGGGLIVHPRPSPKHMRAATRLSAELELPYGGNGVPGGWIFLLETEIQLVEDIVVPDVAGWKKERFPAHIETNWIPVPPDWVCEILSPKTALRDRTAKKEIYAQAQVGHLWLVDPLNMTVEVYRLGSGAFDAAGVYGGDDKARLEPFTEIEIDLGSLWLES